MRKKQLGKYYLQLGEYSVMQNKPWITVYKNFNIIYETVNGKHTNV